MTEPLGFSLKLSQNKYLSLSDTTMDAVLAVTSTGGSAAEAAEVLLVDCSSSMDWPPGKIEAAREAAMAVIDTLRDDVLFAIVQGTEAATMVYPDTPGLLPVNPETRAAAKKAASGLIASGGTAMSTWLRLAGKLMEPYPGRVRHAILLTDGRNQSERRTLLEATLKECDFACDARGIGDDWDPYELSLITRALRGRADAVVEEGALAEDFRQLTGMVMGKVLPELRLRITTAPGTRLKFLKQKWPLQEDFTDLVVETGPNIVELATGPWGAETREYHLCLEIGPGERVLGQEVDFGEVGLVDIGHPTRVLGHFTADRALSGRRSDDEVRVREYDEMTAAALNGLAALELGDQDKAIAYWGVAIRLATKHGNADLLSRLRPIVGPDDTGRMRIKQDIRQRDIYSLIQGASVTGSGHRPRLPEAGGPDLVCAECAWISPPGSKICVKCGHREFR
ncbi:VWA domain-containing protein [Amycolatopsis sp. cg5]|uniref:vWA domain-containing protein n=1 Tax=Amycolatopsis sp. cg5 TaxID=3238802 RepID=UPI003525C4A6